MQTGSFKIKNFRCFRDEWVGFDEVKPINVIIGRNNCGKSCLLNVVDAMAGALGGLGDSVPFRRDITLGRDMLQSVFQSNTSSADLDGNHWHDHGKLLVFSHIVYKMEEREVEILDWYPEDLKSNYYYNARAKRVTSCLGNGDYPFSGKVIVKISAERDVKPEHRSGDNVSPSGEGVTSLLSNYFAQSSKDIDVIRIKLRDELNAIMGNDGEFQEIIAREIGDATNWAIYLREQHKGFIPLHASGSGLKTVLMVLVYLLVLPDVQKKDVSSYVYIFEELENNLHPSLLRRLLLRIEKHAEETGCLFFLTTHSSVMLDMFARSEMAQIIHVQHDGKQARAERVDDFFRSVDVLGDLGVRSSDLLQANGIIWLEGPSDRIYVNRWIELFSEGELREGLDYQCAFYGGAVLAHHGAGDPAGTGEDKVNLFAINHNAIAICDGDRTSPHARLKDSPRRIRDELGKLQKTHVWITEAKEIESYIPVSVLNQMWEKELEQIDQFEPFSIKPTKKNPSGGYFQRHRHGKTLDKVALARDAVRLMTRENLKGVFELEREIAKICECIKTWRA